MALRRFLALVTAQPVNLQFLRAQLPLLTLPEVLKVLLPYYLIAACSATAATGLFTFRAIIPSL